MHPIRQISLFLFLLFTTLLPAQKISGVVRDSTGVAVSYASVVATSCRDEQVLAYTSSGDLGAFQLSINTDCDSITLTARCLGYRTAAHKVLVRSLPATLDFALAGTVLQEVIIRGKTPPVIVRKDTTEFNVASFSDSTEFSVEDLLKKLPGVQVNESGQISYNGKTVERVLIEGDDLFSQNYQIATRNVRADMISKVQVIDRYEENPVLSSIRNTDRMVMNLKIKPERKRSLSGSITGGIGYGSDWKAKGHTNLFSLSRKDKAYLIGSCNNTGQSVAASFGGIDNTGFIDADKQSLQANPLRIQALIPAAQMEGLGLPQAYTSNNRSGLLYLGEVIPFTPHFKIKLSVWAGKDRLWQETSNATRILLEPIALDIAEQKRLAHAQQKTVPEGFY
jgi:Carboxypeptidase regulatory-like domain